MTIYIFTSSVLLATSSPALAICCVFDNSRLDCCDVVSHYGFDLHFSDD